jgi:hypothetical protein
VGKVDGNFQQLFPAPRMPGPLLSSFYATGPISGGKKSGDSFNFLFILKEFLKHGSTSRWLFKRIR